MKKLFALMLSIAMVASLLSGVAFAADISGKINLTTSSTILSGDTYGTFNITGTITTTANALIPQDFAITLYRADTSEVVYTGTAVGGKVNFIIETNLKSPVHYVLSAVRTGYQVANANFMLLFNVVNSSLQFNYSENQEVVMGTVKYADGSIPVGETIGLYWLDTNGKPMGAGIAGSAINETTGSFGFIVDGWGGKAGPIGLVIDGLVHKTGLVNAKALTVTASPNTGIVHTVADTKVTVTATGGPTTNVGWDLKVWKGTVDVTSKLLPITLVADQNWGDPTVGTLKVAFTNDFSDAALRAGTYKLVVTSGTLYKGETTITVVNPVRYTLLTHDKFKQFIIGNNDITFGVGQDVELIETDVNGALVIHPAGTTFVYTVWVDGKLASSTDPVTLYTADFDRLPSGEIRVTPTQLTSYNVRVVVEKKVVGATTTFTKVYDNTFVVPVVGWNVTITPTTMTVGQKYDVIVVVKDKDGNPVNNAEITLTKDGVHTRVSALTYNVQNGTYVFKDLTYALPGTVDLTVRVISATPGAGALRANLVGAITVVGERVYTVTSNVPTLLASKAQAVTLTVSDASGTFIPDVLEMWVGKTKTNPSFTTVDTNNDGLADSIRLTVTALSSTDIVFRATNANGTKMGEVTVKVVLPKLVAADNTKVTENITTELNFKVVDPRDGSVLTSTVTLSAAYADFTMKNAAGQDLGYSVTLDGEYEVFVLATNVGWTAAATAEKAVEIVLKIGTVLVDGTFPIAKATLVSSPNTILVGVPNNLTLTYTDANGNPIVGKNVYVGDPMVLIGKTNADGQVFYALAQGATTSAVFNAATDVTGKFVTLTVLSGFDTEAPVVTAPAVVDAPTAIITITDNTRVHRLMVDGVEINIFPMPVVQHIVSLKAGENVFHVAAMDGFYNVVQTTVTIVRTGATPYTGSVLTTVIGQTGYTVDGVSVPFDVAVMYNVNGDAMMPVRFLEAFGAVVTWNQTAASATATFQYGGRTVVVTIGSNVAYVNGVAVNMIGASGKPAPSILVGGRTMVPLRFVSENLGFDVSWAPPNTITIIAP